ncbi:MAG: glycyl-radical enzyme activating protein [Synergistetes bacterium]|nr:glycyl-radical enzyme activating protein [Synergistota bacterium]MDK2871808.1 pyruvate formate lyase activating enzyme [bacterium]
MSLTQGVIFDIKRYTIHDGPGIRTTVFMKGCPLNCWWCHNPEGISRNVEIGYFEYKCLKCKTCLTVCPLNAITFHEEKGIKIDRNKCNGCGNCAARCPSNALKRIGRTIDILELLSEVEKDIPLYDSSGGGVTFSGGEPLAQPEFLRECLKELKKRYIRTAVDTSGYASQESLESILPYTDVFLYDVKLFDSEEHKKYTGVSNEVIKDNLRLLAKEKKHVILRFPVIPGITDKMENVKGWVGFISKLNNIKEINLLPYHDIEEKYSRLDREYKMKIHSAPKEEILTRIREEFEKIGLKVKIGG